MTGGFLPFGGLRSQGLFFEVFGFEKAERAKGAIIFLKEFYIFGREFFHVFSPRDAGFPRCGQPARFYYQFFKGLKIGVSLTLIRS